MKKVLVFIIGMALVKVSFCQDLYSLELQRMSGVLKASDNGDPKFTLKKIGIATIYEIEYYVIDTANGRNYCINYSYFNLDGVDIKDIKKTIMNHSYVKYGMRYDFLRPSHYEKNSIKEYNLTNLTMSQGDSLANRINEAEYFKIFKSKAIIQKYHSSSADWYKFYFPFQNKNKPFNYYEVVKILDRIEIQKGKRDSFKCNMIID